jgi:hypothetical protein
MVIGIRLVCEAIVKVFMSIQRAETGPLLTLPLPCFKVSYSGIKPIFIISEAVEVVSADEVLIE